MKTLAARFWPKVNKDGPVMPGMSTPCWVWTASRDRAGYGRIGVVRPNGKLSNGLAHRVSFALAHGDTDGEPGDTWALHHCDNPPCVRPDHLFGGDRAANMRDAARKGRLLLQLHPQLAPRTTKLDEDDVRLILELHAKGATDRAIAACFKTTEGNVWAITAGRSWKHISREGASCA